MGITLFDAEREDLTFNVNFWHWRAIVEAVRRLDVLPAETVDGLHQPFCNNGLTRDQARVVAGKIRESLLPTLSDDERVLLDGARTTVPDDGVIHHGNDVQKNYSTNKKVLDSFAEFCERCGGFTVC